MKPERLFFIILFFIIIVSNPGFSQTRKRISDVRKEREKRLKYAPGEIIITYEVSKNKSAVIGKDILDEHDRIRTIISESGITVKKIKPVFSSLINQMVKKNLTEYQINQARAKKRGVSLKNTSLNTSFSKVLTVHFDRTKSVEDVIKALEEYRANFKRQGFELTTIEPNYLYYTNAEVPNDPTYSYQWGVHRIGCEEAWEVSKGSSSVKIAIIDTGIDLEHEDLKDNILEGSGYDFVDIDTVSYKSMGYVLIPEEDYTEPDDIPKDYNGHGTHCAGIIGARGDNAKGISGVCQEVSLIPVKAGFSILNSYAYEEGILEHDNIAEAIKYAADEGADVISMSFGGSERSEIMRQSILYAAQMDVVLVAAAGNESTNRKSYPADFPHVISVSATAYNDRKADFSNYGDWVDICAPGENIWSTVPKEGGSNSNDEGYLYLSGTSMAAPFVAGVAGLLLSVDSTLSADEVETILCENIDFPDEQDIYFGAGIVNADKVLSNPQSSSIMGEITTPEKDQIVTEDFAIEGTHTGDIVNIYIGKGYYPNTWEQLAENIVTTDFSVDVIMESYEDGIYTLKIETSTEQENDLLFHRFFIGDLKGMQQGWPVTLNTYVYEEAHLMDQMAIGDLNKDGLKEVVVVADIPNDPKYINSKIFAQAMYVLDNKGNMVEGWPRVFPEDSYECTKPIIYDIDDDGEAEIIVSVRCGLDEAHFGKNAILVYNFDGTIADGWPLYIDSKDYDSKMSLVDINRDGTMNIIAGSGGGACSACSEQGGIHVFNPDGSYLEGWPVYFEEQSKFPKSPFSITNLDDDPELEICVTKFTNIDPNDSLHYTCAFNHDGTTVDGFPVEQTSWGWTLATADFDHDGNAEIMTQYGLLASNGILEYWDFKPNIYSPISIANVDDDEAPEICFGNANGRPYLVNHDGTIVDGWPQYGDMLTTDRGIIVADVANDDKPEIIPLFEAGYIGSTLVKPGLNVYNADGTLLDGFPRFKNIYDIKDVEVADLDNDGDVEVIALDALSNTIIALDMPKQRKDIEQEWPTKYHDNCRTNNYGYKTNLSNQKPVITDQHQLLIREESVVPKITDLIVNDPDNVFPRDFALMVVDDEAYTHEGNVVYPKDEVVDSIIVLVKIKDLMDESDIYPLVIKTPMFVSASKEEISDLNMFPNPFSNKLTIKLGNTRDEEYTIDLLDHTGREIDMMYKGKVLAGQTIEYISQKDLPEGLYLIRVKTGSEVYCKKLIKK